MQLKSHSFVDGAPIPSEFAFAAIRPKTHITFSTNRNPHLTWTKVPDGTNSFVLRKKYAKACPRMASSSKRVSQCYPLSAAA